MIASLEGDWYLVMVKLTCPRSTSRGHGTRWHLNSGSGIRLPHQISLYHGPTSLKWNCFKKTGKITLKRRQNLEVHKILTPQHTIDVKMAWIKIEQILNKKQLSSYQVLWMLPWKPGDVYCHRAAIENFHK